MFCKSALGKLISKKLLGLGLQRGRRPARSENIPNHYYMSGKRHSHEEFGPRFGIPYLFQSNFGRA